MSPLRGLMRCCNAGLIHLSIPPLSYLVSQIKSNGHHSRKNPGYSLRAIVSKSSKRERDELFKIQQERERERGSSSSSSHQRVVLLDVEIVYALPEETCRCFLAWRRIVEGIHKCPLCPCVFSFPLSVCAGINNVGYDDDDARDAAAHNRTRNRACR